MIEQKRDLNLELSDMCQENICAWLKYRGFCDQFTMKAFPDRCFYPRHNLFDKWISKMALEGVLLEFPSKNHGKDVIVGYRENVSRCGAQVIVHPEEIEIDFDLWTPYDLVGLFGHGWEVLTNRIGKKKTDPRKVREGLKKRGVWT